MGAKTSKIRGGKTVCVEGVKIPASIIKQIESIPDLKRSQYTEEEDAILLAYWGKKRGKELAKILGRSVDSCRHRYSRLILGKETDR